MAEKNSRTENGSGFDDGELRFVDEETGRLIVQIAMFKQWREIEQLRQREHLQSQEVSITHIATHCLLFSYLYEHARQRLIHGKVSVPAVDQLREKIKFHRSLIELVGKDSFLGQLQEISEVTSTGNYPDLLGKLSQGFAVIYTQLQIVLSRIENGDFNNKGATQLDKIIDYVVTIVPSCFKDSIESWLSLIVNKKLKIDDPDSWGREEKLYVMYGSGFKMFEYILQQIHEKRRYFTPKLVEEAARLAGLKTDSQFDENSGSI